MIDLLLLSISMICFWVFCWYAWKRYGVIASISDLFYELKKDKAGILFRLFITGISFPIVVYAVQHYYILPLSGLLIFLVAFTANTKLNKYKAFNHVLGATGGIGIAIIHMLVYLIVYIVKGGSLFSCTYFYSFIISIGLMLWILPIKGIKKGINNHTTWIEVAIFNLVLIIEIINIVLGLYICF